MENDYAVKIANYGIGEDYPEDDYCPKRMLRGPGQKAADPFQFVATKGGEEMAETAKSTLHLAQQQKVQREKILRQQVPKFDDTEPWQADLDTWRRKRKEKIVDPKPEGAQEYSPYRKAKDEILHINSQPQHSNSTTATTNTTNTSSSTDDLNNDSGIENRTVGSPSTSEFSPRSTDLFISPKSLDEEPPHHPPPPPPPAAEPPSELDQVLIPLKYSKQSYYEQPLNKNSYIESSSSSFDYSKMPIINSNSSAKVEATFKQPPSREGVKPFISRAAQSLSQSHSQENIDLTVELNREQKATVTATKYPRSNEFVREKEAPQEPVKTTRIYHAVDIPFDESPATYHPIQKARKSSGGAQMFNMNISMGSQPVHKGFGFSASKRDDRVVVESVIVASPADKAGLLVGDTIISINGEDMSDKYQSRITQILHDSARIGEADILISRAPVILTKQGSSSSTTNFDKARSVFTTNTTDNRSFDSYAEFKRKHSRASRDSTSSSSRSSRDYNSLPRGATTTTTTTRYVDDATSLDRKRDASLSSYRTARENFNTMSTPRSSGRSDYGDYRVTSAFDDKNSPGKLTDFVPEVDRRRNRRDDDEDIYHRLRGGDQTPKTIRNFHVSNENVARTNMTYDGRRESEEESITTTLKRSTLPRSGSATHWRNEYSNDNTEEQTIPVRQPSPLRSALKKSSHNYPPIPRPHHSPSQHQQQQRQYYSTESLYRRQEEGYCSSEEEEEERRMVNSFHTVGSYGVRNGENVSEVSHRFYDRDGRSIRAPRERSIDIEVRREYSTKVAEESRDWRDVINQQRQAAPGYQSDRRGIAAASASLSNLPTYLNRRMEQQNQNERGVGEISEKYERDEYHREEQRNYAPIPQQRQKTTTTTSYEERMSSEKEENVVAVSGKHRCSHCSEELGRGAAMIVESLNLFYHLACFKCYVCKTSLGSGATGADVRVRDGHLHCQTCYSNNRVQLSKV